MTPIFRSKCTAQRKLHQVFNKYFCRSMSLACHAFFPSLDVDKEIIPIVAQSKSQL